MWLRYWSPERELWWCKCWLLLFSMIDDYRLIPLGLTCCAAGPPVRRRVRWAASERRRPACRCSATVFTCGPRVSAASPCARTRPSCQTSGRLSSKIWLHRIQMSSLYKKTRKAAFHFISLYCKQFAILCKCSKCFIKLSSFHSLFPQALPHPRQRHLWWNWKSEAWTKAESAQRTVQSVFLRRFRKVMKIHLNNVKLNWPGKLFSKKWTLQEGHWFGILLK